MVAFHDEGEESSDCLSYTFSRHLKGLQRGHGKMNDVLSLVSLLFCCVKPGFCIHATTSKTVYDGPVANTFA